MADWSSYANINPTSDKRHYYPCLAVDKNGVIHVACVFNYNKVVYSKSSDKGVTWTNWIEIGTLTANGCDYPRIAVDSNANIHIVVANIVGSYRVIKYTKSTNGGVSWSEWATIGSVGTYNQKNPAIAIDSSDNIHVVWHGNDETYQTEYTDCQIKYIKSTDGGSNWSAITNIQPSASYDYEVPDLICDADDILHIACTAYNNSSWVCQVAYTRSLNGGGNWSSWVSACTDADYFLADPKIAVDSNQKVHIVFQIDAVDWEGYWIKYVSSSDGSTWESVETLASNESTYVEYNYPCIAVDSDDNICVAFSFGDEFLFQQLTKIIFMKRSGNTWGLQEEIISVQATNENNSKRQFYPKMFLAYDNSLSMVWAGGDPAYFEYQIKYSRLEGTVTSPTTRVFLEILEYQSTKTAEAGTSSSQIKITGHGLSPEDFIVNTTRRWENAERGARLVGATGLDANTIPLDDSITAGGQPGIDYGPQIEGDSVRLYKYIDRTNMVMPGTFRLNRKAGGQSEGSFTMKTNNSFILYPGNYMRLYMVSGATTTQLFRGIINEVRQQLLTNKAGISDMYMQVSFYGYNQIPARRTIQISYPTGTTYGDIVQDMLDLYLFQDGIKKTTIGTGGTLTEDWRSDAISISDVLDECAEKSGYQWFIDDEGYLQFYEEPSTIPDADISIDTTSNVRPFRKLEMDWSLDNYYNKTFVCGGYDEKGNDIIFGAEDFSKSTEMQNLHAGTGVYGVVVKDGSITEGEYKTAESATTSTVIAQTNHGVQAGDIIWNFTRDVYRIVRTVLNGNSFEVDEIVGMVGSTSDTAEAGTTTTIIKMTNHGLNVGDGIYNSTRNAYRNVVRVLDADNVTVDTVPSQAEGDTIKRGGDIIVYFNQTNKFIRNKLKKESTRPASLSFETNVLSINPAEKLNVNIPELNISDEDFLVESVSIFDNGLGPQNFWARINATRRDGTNFTTQRIATYIDFWGGF
jgi:hypothetical protein